MSEPEGNGWIEWGGGECPLPEGTIADIRFSDGSIYRRDSEPQRWRWKSDRRDGFMDIIGYRVVTP